MSDRHHGSDLTSRRDHDRDKAQRSHATLRARLARELDPDNTLTHQRRDELVDAEITRRASADAARWSQVAAERRTHPAQPAAGRAQKAADPAGENIHARVRALLETSAARRALAARNVTAVYRMLREGGVLQREIAQLTGQAPSEVSEVLAGRTVVAYDVLVRIAEGLGVPRGWMGLTYTDAHGIEVAYRDDGDFRREGGVSDDDEAMKRANLLRQGALVLLGAAVFGVPSPVARASGATPMPSRLTQADVEQVKAVTTTIRALARAHGGGADTATAAAARAWDLLAVPAEDAVRAAYSAAVSELFTLAGWTCVDSGLYDHARDHFAAAMTTAGQAEDDIALACALRYAGAANLDRRAWDDALKAFQLGLFRLGISADPRAPAMAAVLHGESARALAAMDQPDAARMVLGRARDGWEPPDAFAAANHDLVAALITMRLGRLDLAESFAMTSVRGWGEARRDAVMSDVTLARIHLQAGEPDGALLSQRAIQGMAETRSVRARRVWLAPLGADLAARQDSTCQDLAERVRQIVTAA